MRHTSAQMLLLLLLLLLANSRPRSHANQP
jgi:hypothetical protein